MIRRTSAIAGSLLALFHAWLLLSQFWHGELAEPALVLRWLAAAGLAAGLVAVRRRGASLFWGRKAVSIWLLAALLHGPAAVAADARLEEAPLTETATAILQIAVASIIAGIGLALAAWLSARRLSTPPPSSGARTVAVHRVRAVGRELHFAPRPPPLAVPAR